MHSGAQAMVRDVVRDTRDDAMELVCAFGERCRSWLQDVRRLDLVDVPVANGGYILPSRATGDPFRAHGLPAPRRDDDIRPSLDHGLRCNDSVAAEPRIAKLGKNRIAARDLDQFFNPPDA